MTEQNRPTKQKSRNRNNRNRNRNSGKAKGDKDTKNPNNHSSPSKANTQNGSQPKKNHKNNSPRGNSRPSANRGNDRRKDRDSATPSAEQKPATGTDLNPHEAELLAKYPKGSLSSDTLNQEQTHPQPLTHKTWFFETFHEAKAQLPNLIETPNTSNNIVVKQEGDMKDPELIQFGTVYAGAAWFLIFSRRVEEGVLASIEKAPA